MNFDEDDDRPLGAADVVELHTPSSVIQIAHRPRPGNRPASIPGHAGHFHPAAVGPVLQVDCELCRARMVWYRTLLDKWES